MRLHVRRRLVVAERRVVREVEVFVAQFAADEDERAADAQPAAVDWRRARLGGVIALHRLMHEVVVEADDVAADVDRHRHERDALDGLAGEFEDRRLAVAGSAPEHRRAAGREREADLRDDIAGEHELLQGAGEADRVRRADLLVVLEDPEVVLDRHRDGADVLAAAEGVFRLVHAKFGEAVLPFGFEAAGGRGGLDEALAAAVRQGLRARHPGSRASHWRRQRGWAP